MNIAQVGLAGSVATAALAQSRASDTEKVQQETTVQQRALDSIEQAESAAGIGTTNEEQAASDRDADGRQAWELNPAATAVDDSAATDCNEQESARGKDPTGTAGSHLDLRG